MTKMNAKQVCGQRKKYLLETYELWLRDPDFSPEQKMKLAKWIMDLRGYKHIERKGNLKQEGTNLVDFRAMEAERKAKREQRRSNRQDKIEEEEGQGGGPGEERFIQDNQAGRAAS